MNDRKTSTPVSVRACLIGYLIVLFLSFFSLSIPPANLLFYGIMLLLSLFAVWRGAYRTRVFGFALVIIAIFFCCLEIQAGIQHANKMKHRQIKLEQQKTGSTNSP
jgi:hypothetical protein